jgi:hypothetical protein
MDRIQLTGNGSKVNLIGKIREITSSELIFGGLQLFETTVLPCMASHFEIRAPTFQRLKSASDISFAVSPGTIAIPPYFIPSLMTLSIKDFFKPFMPMPYVCLYLLGSFSLVCVIVRTVVRHLQQLA